MQYPLIILLDVLPSLETVRGATEYSFSGQFLKMILTLGGFIAVLLALAWTYRKLGFKKSLFGNSKAYIQILERRPLSQKSALYLVEIDEQRFLLGDSPAGPRCVAELDKDRKPTTSFEEVLERTAIS